MNSLTMNAPTMSSLELVKIINDMREEGQAELRHDNFMQKIVKVLGEGGVLKFQGTYLHPQNGQEYPCYYLPKREAHLMVMSESYKVQARVYDRWQELETGLSIHKTESPFTHVDKRMMGLLMKLSPPIAMAYLVDCGVTLDYVRERTYAHGVPPEPADKPKTQPRREHQADGLAAAVAAFVAGKTTITMDELAGQVAPPYPMTRRALLTKLGGVLKALSWTRFRASRNGKRVYAYQAPVAPMVVS
jgi:hypothetical protein